MTTPYNQLAYNVVGVETSVSLDDLMPDMRSRCGGSQKQPEEESQERQLTFRQYYKCAGLPTSPIPQPSAASYS